MFENTQMLYHGRFLVDIQPEDHSLNKSIGASIVRWNLVDLDEGQDHTGLATSPSAAWTEAVTAARRVVDGTP